MMSSIQLALGTFQITRSVSRIPSLAIEHLEVIGLHRPVSDRRHQNLLRLQFATCFTYGRPIGPRHG
jgi:hypothetical protein